jgi:hypothetical protein
MKNFKKWFNGLNEQLQILLSFVFIPVSITMILVVLLFGVGIVSVISDGFSTNDESKEAVAETEEEEGKETAVSTDEEDNEENTELTDEENSEVNIAPTDEQGNEEEVKPADEEDNEKVTDQTSEEEMPEEITKEYSIMGLDIRINDITIDGKYLDIDMTATNTTDQSLSFYFDQGDIVIKNKQVSSNFLMNKGDLGGDIHPGVEKEGLLRFVLPDDIFDDAEEITLKLGNIYDEHYNSEEFTDTMQLK